MRFNFICISALAEEHRVALFRGFRVVAAGPLLRKLVAERAARMVAPELRGALAQAVHQVLDDRIADRFLINNIRCIW